MLEERKLNNENNRTTRSNHPTIIGLALLATAIVFICVTGKKVPLLSNIRVDIILLVVIGIPCVRKAESDASPQRDSGRIRFLSSVTSSADSSCSLYWLYSSAGNFHS